MDTCSYPMPILLRATLSRQTLSLYQVGLLTLPHDPVFLVQDWVLAGNPSHPMVRTPELLPQVQHLGSILGQGNKISICNSITMNQNINKTSC